MKYFVRLNLQGLPKNKQENSVASTEQKRDSKNDKRQYEIWTFEGLSTLSGGFNLKNKSGNTIKGVPNIVPKGGKPPEEGDRIVVGFHNGNRHKPFCIYSGISNHLGAWIAPPDHYAPWLRLAVRAAHRWFASAWDDPATPNSAIVFAADERLKSTGSIVRTDSQGVLWWAESNKLRSRSLATGAETTTDLGSEITALSLCPLTERPYAWAGVYDPGEEQVEAYEQGWQAALVALEALEDTVRNQGYYDCSSETEYQAETMAIYYAYSELPAPTSPPVDEDEIGNYQSGWSDAVMSETKRLYDEGWRDSGCEMPES